MKILLTGSTGFVGKRLLSAVTLNEKYSLVCPVRRYVDDSLGQQILIDEINSSTDWSAALSEVKVVVHSAGLAHVARNRVADLLTEYRRVNVEGTLNLALQAAAAGVKRFIFISSIKVNGEETRQDVPFTASGSPAPEDPYGLSKLEAEQGLIKLVAETEMEVVIIRPPLVYGPGVKGNFASMIKLVERGIPLPLGAVHNQRSLVGIDNLVDLIIRCIDHPRAANQVFLAGDGEDLSTTELLQKVAKAMGRPARLIQVPAGLLKFGAALLGKKAVAQRLLGSLQVDISKTCELLEWRPPYTVEENLRRCFPKSR